MHAASTPVPQKMTGVSQALLMKYRICIYATVFLEKDDSTPAQVNPSNYTHIPTFSSAETSAIMRTTLVSAILLTLSAVDAKKHRLCCCSGIDDNAPGLWSEKSITCLQKPSEEVVAEAPRYKFIKSNQIWSYNLDKNAPFGDANSTHWVCSNSLPLLE